MPQIMTPIKGEPGKYFIPALKKKIAIIDYREGDLYDTVLIPSGAIAAGATYHFFRDLEGKNLQDTNFTTPRRIEAGTEMIITRLGIVLHSTTGNTIIPLADAKKVLENGYLTFKINKMDVDEGFLMRFQSGYGLAGSTVETNQSIFSNGVPSAAAAPTLLVPQEITVNHDLQAQIEFFDAPWISGFTMPTLSQAVKVKFILHGYIKKMVGK